MQRFPTFVLFAILIGIAPPAGAADLEWRDEWPRYRVAEGVATGVLFAGGAALNFGLGSPDHGNWRNPILVDRPVRRAVAANSTRVADDFGLASDMLTGTLMAYPFAVDSGAVALGLHRRPREALQIALLGAESFAVSTFLMTAGKHAVARQRPPSTDCSREGPHNLYCSDERFESFPSGHTTYAFTGASYLCAIHEHLDLYGGGWAEPTACWTAVGLAAGSGFSRLVSDNHYASDVAAGAALGIASGYVLPKLLHFGWGPEGADTSGRTALLASPRRVSLTLSF